jgi:pyruvate dehydrogenase E2 component (dihydrolipoamide acetyltransferase)
VAVADFLLPDVGEGLTEAEIVQWRVKKGDVVAVNDILVEIETAKSLVELPSPFAGTIVALLAGEGDTVPVGTAIIQVDSTTGVPATLHAAPEPVAPPAAPAAKAKGKAKAEPAAEPVLVGYGSAGQVASRRGARTQPSAPAEPSLPQAAAEPVAYPPAGDSPVMAKPPVRKLAKELGVDISKVLATGTRGEVTRDDVVRQSQVKTVFRNVETPEWPSEREEYIPVKGVRKAKPLTCRFSSMSTQHERWTSSSDSRRPPTSRGFAFRLSSSWHVPLSGRFSATRT